MAELKLVFDVSVQKQFRDLLVTAVSFGNELVKKRTIDAAKLVSELSRSDPDVAKLIEAHPFDAVAFFGDHEVADAFLSHGMVAARRDNSGLFRNETLPF